MIATTPSSSVAALAWVLVLAILPACAPRTGGAGAGQASSAARDRSDVDRVPTDRSAGAPVPWPTYVDELPPTPFDVDTLTRRTFNYFWELADGFGQSPDRWPTERFSSIAATGFSLAALAVGVERGYVTREAAAARARQTLNALWVLPQGDAQAGVAGYRGLFYHFLNHSDGLRYRDTELSTIDSGLLLAGVLAAGEYFKGDSEDEREIRRLSEALYRRVEWDFAYMADGSLSMGWRPDKGFIPARWKGYNEANILLILALGSPTHPIPDTAWQSWTRTYQWGSGYGARDHLMFDPMFGHQYSHLFIDFRGLQDPYMRSRGIDYFENSVRATELQLAYATQNPMRIPGYGPNLWGLTACDGPGRNRVRLPEATLGGAGERNEAYDLATQTLNIRDYWARGVDGTVLKDDGTIAPTAAGGSWPFLPEACAKTLSYQWTTYHKWLVGRYGFRDAFNLLAPPRPEQTGAPGWFDVDYLGIDQGAMLLQIENHRSGLVWDLLKTNPHVLRGLRRAGFTGGWLEEAPRK